jgi:hypothetical protein
MLEDQGTKEHNSQLSTWIFHVELPCDQLSWSDTPHPCVHENQSKKNLTEQCDGVFEHESDLHLRDEKWSREFNIREKNTILQNLNFVSTIP